MKIKITFFIFLLLLLPAGLNADLEEDLRKEAGSVEKQNAKAPDFSYFYEMAAVARKAEEAHLTELAAEITRSLLLARMDERLKDEMNRLNLLMTTDAYGALKRMEELKTYEKIHEPSAGFLATQLGQMMSAEMVLFRKAALEGLRAGCTQESVLTGLQAVRKTGLFITNRPEETRTLAELVQELDCCLAWSPKLETDSAQEFQSRDQAGILSQQGRLVFTGDRRNLTEGRWEGEWIYRFKGREGTSEAVSPASLTFKRGEDTGQLLIVGARVSSSAAMEFPAALSGSQKTIEIKGTPLLPRADFISGNTPPLMGCKARK